MAWSEQSLARVLGEQKPWLLTQPGVTDAGVTRDPAGDPCLEIWTDSLRHTIRNHIKERLTGIPLQFTECGGWQARQTPHPPSS